MGYSRDRAYLQSVCYTPKNIFMSSGKFDLIIVGHLAWNRDITPHGERISPGGGALYCASGAVSVKKLSIGVVARIGSEARDAELIAILKDRLGVNTDGVASSGGRTAFFTQVQYANGHRDFQASMGVSKIVLPKQFPKHYLKCRHIHFPTAPPGQYIRWITALRNQINPEFTISVDAFEAYARTVPDETKAAFALADIVFLNEEEARFLGGISKIAKNIPCILKRGRRGAVYLDKNLRVEVDAPKVRVLDTTGAGDVLAGAFLAQKLSGQSIKHSLIHAVAIASRSVTHFGVEHIMKSP